MDKVYGNLGRDLVETFPSFTIDFANMRFFIEPDPTAEKPGK
jgi:hypothetical protein